MKLKHREIPAVLLGFCCVFFFWLLLLLVTTTKNANTSMKKFQPKSCYSKGTTNYIMLILAIS